MNLIAIAGPPPQSGVGGCGCTAVGANPMGDVPRPNPMNWIALGCFGAAFVIGYFVIGPVGSHR
jgi:hypothetical protein